MPKHKMKTKYEKNFKILQKYKLSNKTVNVL